MLHEIDWVAVLGSNDSRVFLHAVSAVVDHPLESERGETTEGENGEFATDDEGNSLKKRFMAHTRRLEQLRALVPTSQVAEAIHEDVAFFDAVRPSIAKIEAGGRDSSQTDAALEIAVQQIVSEHMSGSGLIDIYAKAGLGKPNISLIDDEFAEKFASSKNQNLQLEMVRHR